MDDWSIPPPAGLREGPVAVPVADPQLEGPHGGHRGLEKGVDGHGRRALSATGRGECVEANDGD